MHSRQQLAYLCTRPALEAGHIQSFAGSGQNSVSNALLRRSAYPLHQGLLTVTNDPRVEVSRQIKDKYDNGREYDVLEGQRRAIVPSLV